MFICICYVVLSYLVSRFHRKTGIFFIRTLCVSDKLRWTMARTSRPAFSKSCYATLHHHQNVITSDVRLRANLYKEYSLTVAVDTPASTFISLSNVIMSVKIQPSDTNVSDITMTLALLGSMCKYNQRSQIY